MLCLVVVLPQRNFKETPLTVLVLEGDMAQYTLRRWHRSAETCRSCNVMIVFLLR
jgi:hypothetical protein